jgi:hypothetical protein
MPNYHLHLYDTSGRRVTRGSLRISAPDDLEAIARTAMHHPSDVYRAILLDGRRVVAEWLIKKSADPRQSSSAPDLTPAEASA